MAVPSELGIAVVEEGEPEGGAGEAPAGRVAGRRCRRNRRSRSRSNRRSYGEVPARHGRHRASHPRGRGRAGEADRGRAAGRAGRPVREPADRAGSERVAGRGPGRFAGAASHDRRRGDPRRRPAPLRPRGCRGARARARGHRRLRVRQAGTLHEPADRAGSERVAGRGPGRFAGAASHDRRRGTHGGGRHRYGRADAEAPEHEQEGTDGSGSGRPGLSTMETAVLPRAMETLNAIAASCAKLRRLQEQRIELARKNRTLAASQERRRHALQRDLATSIRSLRLTSARIEVVVDDPRVASERLRWCEGAPLRMAIECGVPREAFLKQHEGREHQSGWLSRVGRPRGGGWKTLAAVKRPQLLALRREILTLARETTTVPVDLKAERRDGPWWRARGAAGHRRDDRG